MLHIHSGDSTAAAARHGNLPGTHAVWCDTLFEGPVLIGLSAEDWRATRARILARQSANMKLADMYVRLLRQDEAMARAVDHDEVVVWVDACLYDQLLLIRHLNWFAEQSKAPATLSLISVGEFPGMERFTGLGELTGEQLAGLHEARNPVTAEQLALAQAAWAAFSAPDPRGIEQLIAGDTAALPHLAAAMHRHLEQYPAVGTGLSRLDREVLQVVAEGADRLSTIFSAVSAMEECPFFGDTTLWLVVENLGRARVPALQIDGPQKLPRFDEPDADLNQWTISLTDEGKALLNGEVDWTALNRVDRWLGGVHLYANKVNWRWDPDAACIRQMEDAVPA